MRQMNWMERIKGLKQVRTLLVQFLFGLALLCLPQQGHAVSFTVGSATVTVGQVFTINLNVVDAVDLTSWQFNLAYDPTKLQADLVSEGTFLSTAGTTFFTPGVIDNTTGVISLAAASFVDLIPPSGSGILASIQFTALSAGLSPLTASNVFLNFLDSGFTITNGSVCVTSPRGCNDGGGTVPEASSVLLVLLSMALLVGLRRWRQIGESGTVSQ